MKTSMMAKVGSGWTKTVSGGRNLPSESSLFRKVTRFLLRIGEGVVGLVLALFSGLLQAVGLVAGIVVSVVLLVLPVLLLAAFLQGVSRLLQSCGWL